MTAADATPENTLVFLAGLHRSGTSILFRALREHSRISGFRDTGVPEDEGQHLQTVYRPAKVYGGPGRFGFDERVHLTEDSPLATAANAAKLFGEWSPHWDLSKPVLVEKSPPNLLRTRFLQALFPRSRFVVIVRHPVAVAYATQKWSRTPVSSLIAHWLHCHEVFAADRARLSRVRVLHYEDFVADPPGTLAGIHRFLDLDPEPNDLEVRANVNEAYFARWRGRSWIPLRRAYLRAVRNRYEERVRAFGYSLVDLDDRRPESIQPGPE
jgi:hypothetical protein